MAVSFWTIIVEILPLLKIYLVIMSHKICLARKSPATSSTVDKITAVFIRLNASFTGNCYRNARWLRERKGFL
jgi:hypothetical protein